jgi:hypothetical protein
VRGADEMTDGEMAELRERLVLEATARVLEAVRLEVADTELADPEAADPVD